MASNDLELRIRITADGRAAIEGTRDVERQIDHLGGLASKVGPLIAGYLSFEFLKGAVTQLFDAGAALQDFQTRFGSLAGSAQAAAAEMDYVRQTAQKLGLGLNEARESYAQLLAQQQAGVITLQQSRDLLEGFGRAAQMTGAGSEQVKQAMLGLSQALSSGTVSTEDFRQAVDPLPGMMKRFADALGVSIGQLKENLADGKVSSADFAQAMIKGLQEAGKGAEDFSASLSATWQRVKNEWTLLLEAFGAADFLSMIEGSSFNDAMAALLSGMEETLKTISAFIRSGWLSDAFSAERTYIQAFLADTEDAFADMFADVAQRAKTGWDAFTAPVRPQLDALQDNFLKVFTDLPEVVASFTVIAAATVDGWVADLNVAWALVANAFVVEWERMKGFLADVLNAMIVNVASAVNSMGQLLGGFLTGAAEKLRMLPDFMQMGSVADAFQAGADRITQASAGLVEAANERRDAALAETQVVIAGENAKLQAVQDAAQATQAAAAQTAQDMALEFNARTQARDAAIAKAQADRQAGDAVTAQTPVVQANTAAAAANAGAKDEAAKAAADHAAKIAEELQSLAQDTAALQRLTQAYLTFNDAQVAQVKIENELEKLDPAVREAARAKALEELNNQVAQRLYDLERENQLSVQESVAILTSTQALDEFLIKKELETILRERHTGALDAETAKIVEQKLFAEQLAHATDEVMDAYRESLTPLEKYNQEMERLAKIEAQMKGQAGAWTEAAQQGVAQLRKEAEETRLAADPLAQAFQDAADSIYGAWNDMFVSLFQGNKDAFKDFAETLKNLFLKMIAEMAAAALAKPILVPIMQMVGGAFGLPGGDVTSIIGSTLGLPQGGSNLLSMGTSLLNSGDTYAMNGAFDVPPWFTGAGASTGGGFLSGITNTITNSFAGISSGFSSLISGSILEGFGAIASAALPVLGPIAAIAAMLGDVGPTPHPSSLAVVGGHLNSENGPEYMGKGSVVTGASGLKFGFDYGHTDPAEAQKIRDMFVEIDKTLTAFADTVDFSKEIWGAYGSTAEGFVGLDAPNAKASYWEDMDQVTEAFVKTWVDAATKIGAVSETVNAIVKDMDGSVEELMAMFSVLQELDRAGELTGRIGNSLQQLVSQFDLTAEDLGAVVNAFQTFQDLGGFGDALFDIALNVEGGKDQLLTALQGLTVIGQYANADLFGDFEAALADATRSTFDRLAALVAENPINDALANLDWADAAQIADLANQVQARYALEAQLIQDIQGYLVGLSQNFSDSIESIQLSVMDTAQKYDYYAQQAASAFAALEAASDPADIARLAETARNAAMQAYSLVDEAQKQALSTDFVQFLNDTQTLASGKLNDAQQAVVDQHQATADALKTALETAGAAAAQAMETASQTAAETLTQALSTPITVDVAVNVTGGAASGMAAGGFVGGAWNGRSGIGGDTVTTLLTPGEAVIPRTQAQKHRTLIESIMGDQVRYAALGQLPNVDLSGSATNRSDFGTSKTITSASWNTWILGNANTHSISHETTFVSINQELEQLQQNAQQSAVALADMMEDVNRQIEQMEWGQMTTAIATISEKMVDSYTQAQALGASEAQLNQIRHLAELQIKKLQEELLQSFDDALEAIQLATMTDAEKYAHYTEVAESAFTALKTATDPGEIERLANEARTTTMTAWGLLDESQRKALSSGFQQFLVDLQALVDDRLTDSVAAGGAVLEQALAGVTQQGAEMVDQVGQRMGLWQQQMIQNWQAQAQAARNDTPVRLAAGGFVGGTWNGRSGIAGDTVATMLTPGEAVIPRTQAQKHRSLIESIMGDSVRYAALGQLPNVDLSSATAGALPDWMPTADSSSSGSDSSSAADDAARQAEQLAELIARLTRELRDLTALTDFDRQLNGISDTLADTQAQITELGGSAEATALAQAIQMEQERKLRMEQRQQQEAFLQPYQDAAEGLTGLDAALRDLERNTADALTQAADLGITDTTLITDERDREAARMQAEFAQQLTDFMQTYRDQTAGADGQGYLPFIQQSIDVSRQTEAAIAQAQALGASEDDLARIRQAHQQQFDALIEETRQAQESLLEPYRDVLNNTSDFDQQLRDLARQTADAIQQAKDLGATEDQLAIITAGAAAMEAKLREERAQALTDFMAGFDIGPIAEFEKALYDLARRLDANLEQAKDLGATESDIAKIREWTSDQAVQAAQAAIDQEIATFESAAAAVASTLEQISNSLRSLKDSIENNLLDFNRLQPDWNEVAYQNGRVTDLKGQLAAADELPIDQRISLAEQLRAAVMNRYQAEMEAQQALQQEQEQADAETRANLEKLVQIAKNLKQYLDSLRLSDLSTLSPEQKLAEAHQQYQDILAQAQGGDIEAQGNLQGAAQAYLQEARSYYASTEAYAGIFDQVTATLDALAAQWQTQGEGGLAAMDGALSAYEEQSLALADTAAAELQAILPLLSDWQAEATATATAETDKLRATLNANTTAITSAVSTSGLILAAHLDAAMAAMTATVAEAMAAHAAQLAAAQAQAIAAAQAPSTVTAHATGGVATGWSLVGEQGPELVNFTEPGRVYTAQDTLRMLSANDSSEDTEAVVLELKALVRLQANANQQLINKLDAVESRLAGIESKARLEAAA